MEKTPQQRKEEAVAWCQHMWPEWHAAYIWKNRSAGMSGNANKHFDEVNRTMDHLLEDVFAHLVTLELVDHGQAA